MTLSQPTALSFHSVWMFTKQPRKIPTSVLQKKLPHHYFKQVDLRYVIISESGERMVNWVTDVPLNQHDTTRVLVEYERA